MHGIFISVILMDYQLVIIYRGNSLGLKTVCLFVCVFLFVCLLVCLLVCRSHLMISEIIQSCYWKLFDNTASLKKWNIYGDRSHGLWHNTVEPSLRNTYLALGCLSWLTIRVFSILWCLLLLIGSLTCPLFTPWNVLCVAAFKALFGQLQLCVVLVFLFFILSSFKNNLFFQILANRFRWEIKKKKIWENRSMHGLQVKIKYD